MALLYFPALADLHGDGEYKVSILPQQKEIGRAIPEVRFSDGSKEA